MKTLRKPINPSKRELFVGLSMVAVLACVSMSRLGAPRTGLADTTTLPIVAGETERPNTSSECERPADSDIEPGPKDAALTGDR
jgi:hypothetical protein